MQTILRSKDHPSDEDVQYALDKLSKLKDERLQDIFVKTLRWSEEDALDLEYFVALSLRVLNKTNPSRIRDAARALEIRFYTERS